MRARIPVWLIALSLTLSAEQYHPQEEMEPYECYAEYGTNCEEAEEYEQEQYEQDQEDQEDEGQEDEGQE